MGNKPDGTAGNPLNVTMLGGSSSTGGGLSGMLSSLLGGGAGGGMGSSAGIPQLAGGAGGDLGDLADMAAFFHSGTSYVGTPSRMVHTPPGLFIDAPRLHSGLAPDEFPAILQRGERVTPRGGGGSGGVRDVHIHVNTPDTTSFGRTGSQIARSTKREMSRVR